MKRVTVLAGLLAGLLVLSLVLLRAVFGTIFFAITVAYVLNPVRTRLVDHGLSARIAATIATGLAFVGAALVVLPLVVVLYIRRQDLVDFVRTVPAEVVVELGGVRYPIELATYTDRITSALGSLAFDVARVAPALAFKLFLFVLLVYALLIRPDEISAALLRPVPREYHDVVMSMHRRVKSALYAIYVLQAATAFGTFLLAYVFFTIFGYDAAFSLSVISGILQFIPIVGPSIVILALAAFEVTLGNTVTALLVAAVGLFFVGFLPDAVIRTQLASLTAEMSGSLYFIGFTGGILSIGIVGVIAGPVLVAMLAEAGQLLGSERRADYSD